MSDELIDVYTDQNEPLGTPLMKSEVHRKGLWHRGAHIWIYNRNGEILLQLRAPQKDFHPNVWDVSAAGHIGAGEEPIVAAVRELKEELGLGINPDDLSFYTIRIENNNYKEIISNEFQYVYFLRFDGELNTLAIQAEEVAGVKFFGTDVLEHDLKINSDHYVPPLEYWFEIIDEVKRRTIPIQ